MKWIKKLSIYVIVICIISLLLTLIGESTSKFTFELLFLDRLFFINLICFVITGIVFIDNLGTFNVFKYSLRHVRATVSKKYKTQLISTNDELKSDQDIKAFLQKKYLYAERRHSTMHAYFTFSAIIFSTYLFVTFMLI